MSLAAGRAAILCLALLGLAACGKTPSPAVPVAAPLSRWAAQRDAYIEATLAEDPVLAIALGRHEYDGRLTDYSQPALHHRLARLHAARAQFSALPVEALSPAERFERDYLVMEIDANLFWLEIAEQPVRDPSFYADNLDPAPYLERAYAPLPVRLRGYIDYLQAVPMALRTARDNLRLPLAASLLEHAIATFNGYAAFYGDGAPAVFEAVADPALHAELDAATRQAIAATRQFAQYLSQQRPHATQDFALGAQRFAQMLRMTEGVTTPLPQLKAVGEADLARNLAALKAACALYAPGATNAACMAKARDHKLAGGAVEAARAQVESLRRFLQDHDIVTLPAMDAVRVVESPPYARDFAAALSSPGPFEKQLPAYYYISPPDPKWSRKEQRDYVPGAASLLFTSVHEVWPGHFLQSQIARRVASPVGRLFNSYAFVEGWAHYAEELMLQKGLWDRSPEAQVGQVTEALLRDVRLLSAIGLHTEGMSLKQSERLFVTQAYQSAASARQEAARGSFDPGYLSYTLGKLMIRKLRTDWCASRGGEAAWKSFHDQFLSYGSPPIPLVRRAMLGDDSGDLL